MLPRTKPQQQRVERVRKGAFCLHSSPMSVDYLRNFRIRGGFLVHIFDRKIYNGWWGCRCSCVISVIIPLHGQSTWRNTLGWFTFLFYLSIIPSNFLYLSIYLYLLSKYLCVYLYLYLLSKYLCVYLYLYFLSKFLCVYLYLFSNLSTYLSIYLFIYLSCPIQSKVLHYPHVHALQWING